MEVIRPNGSGRRTRGRQSKRLLILVLLVTGVSGYFWFRNVTPSEKADKKNETTEESHQQAPAPKTGDFKQFSGEEFKELARSIKYPNVQFFETAPPITGNDAADAHIRAIAESRGYVLTSIPINAIQKINEKYLMGDDLLQPPAAIAWEKLKGLARQDGVPLSMTSAYRSPAYQRDLFVERLLASGVTVQQVAAGGGDAAIATTLQKAAIPGYSRHHTGYTIDLWCDDGSAEFAASVCFRWMNADNYRKPKEAGWIPSYPEGAGLQGPEPESWEYIWVGEENLRQ